MTQNDQQIQELLEKIAKQKKELKKPSSDYETNMLFPWKSAFNINLTTVNILSEVVDMLGYLINEKERHDQASKILDVFVPFKHGNYSYDDWVEDFKSVAYKISYKEKKKVLADTESRLHELMSKEMKDNIELNNLAAIINGWKNN